jgi:hypothetical protein
VRFISSVFATSAQHECLLNRWNTSIERNFARSVPVLRVSLHWTTDFARPGVRLDTHFDTACSYLTLYYCFIIIESWRAILQNSEDEIIRCLDRFEHLRVLFLEGSQFPPQLIFPKRLDFLLPEIMRNQTHLRTYPFHRAWAPGRIILKYFFIFR